ncbi:hypothetical protein [Pedobacter steynii]|uniref:Uncharacterized protein n=1 Tax=Pedobacter steynii TaxID=430522 RepID=A0A1D7QL16_9SPHI|nr:hypothetical protein [Pedobacter steynii]AOM79366.1 hypothetical protein BFS30_20640 [Pedobacter steynii]
MRTDVSVGFDDQPDVREAKKQIKVPMRIHLNGPTLKEDHLAKEQQIIRTMPVIPLAEIPVLFKQKKDGEQIILTIPRHLN